MGEPENSSEYVRSVVDEIGDEVKARELEKRYQHALLIAGGAGDVLRTALGAGLPYSMAQEMAQDFWAAEYVAAGLIVMDEGQAPDVDGEDDE
ncbi:hypothetical protein [Streptomyces sp. NPDC001422]|uniref:hypothetical protein n=1 Tax=Streptomyces sp. NPDC001422 TaxID=3364575 RepID=UPI003676E487